MMDMASAINGQATRICKFSSAGRISGVTAFDSVEAAEAVWRSAQTPDFVFTPFQRFEFVAAWQSRVGVPRGEKPLILVAQDSARQPLLVLPLTIRSRRGVRVASFPGGKHSTFNMPLYRRDLASALTKDDVRDLVGAIRNHAPGIDLLAITQQLDKWQGLANPMTMLPRQISANTCPEMRILADAKPTAWISNSVRKRLRGKERKLQNLPGYRYVVAESDADINRLLDAFFAVKPKRMAAQKLHNVFAEPGVEQFIRQACSTRLPDGRRVIEIHAIETSDEMLAVFAGASDGDRFSMMFNTYTLSEHARYSPGLILTRNIIDHYAARGFTSLDLGIGADDYKTLFCKDVQIMSDSFIPLSARGTALAPAISTFMRAKRSIKRNPALTRIARTLRTALPR